MQPGMTVTLKGKQAETFVRARMSVGDGTNASRQIRQREWLDGATALISGKTGENPGKTMPVHQSAPVGFARLIKEVENEKDSVK